MAGDSRAGRTLNQEEMERQRLLVRQPTSHRGRRYAAEREVLAGEPGPRNVATLTPLEIGFQVLLSFGGVYLRGLMAVAPDTRHLQRKGSVWRFRAWLRPGVRDTIDGFGAIFAITLFFCLLQSAHDGIVNRHKEFDTQRWWYPIYTLVNGCTSGCTVRPLP